MAGKTLDQRGTVDIGAVTLRAPGLRGTVTVDERDATRDVRGSRAERGPLAEAKRANQMSTSHVVAIDDPRDVPRPGAADRGGRRPGPTDMSLTVPAPASGQEQVVLSTDEHGVRTWHFSASQSGADGVRSARRTRTYEIHRTAAASPSSGTGARGAVPGASKIIEVITFPIADAFAQGAKFAVGAWDRRTHPHTVRMAGPPLRPMTDADWEALTKGPALLFVHGTFSTTEGAFGALPPDTMATLLDRYDGRVIAFDHPTIVDDPFDNARAFLDMAGDRRLDLDIVCHSRGGLVARSIAERPAKVRRAQSAVNVNRIVFVGVPNEGTILADADHWNELVDRFTTMLSLAPLPGASDVLESVLALVRSMAVKTAKALDGLSCMAPDSAFLKHLNGSDPSSDAARYVAIVSDFEPTDAGLKAWLNDVIRDRIFSRLPNDMMVRIDSMCGESLSNRFPIAERDRYAYASSNAVEHSGYFPLPPTSTALLDWLDPVAPLVDVH